MGLFSKQLHRAGQEISLTDDERTYMRERVVSYMEHKPMREVLEYTNKKPLSLWETFISGTRMQHVSGALVIALVVTSGSFGVSYAATDALPGDLLYPIKVHVNEEVRSVLLANNDEAQLKWERTRAEKRLEEASTLAAAGRLDAELSDNIALQFSKHADKVVSRARAVEEEDPLLAAEVVDEFETALDTHEAVLARLAVEKDDGTQNTRNLVTRVHSAAVAAGKVLDDAEDQIASDELQAGNDAAGTSTVATAATSTGDDEDAALRTDEEKKSAHLREAAMYRVETRARAQLERVHRALEEAADDTQIEASIRKQISAAQELMNRASIRSEEGDLGAAYRLYREAAASLQTIAQLLEVQQLFSIDIGSIDDNEGADGQETTQPSATEQDVDTVYAETEHLIHEARERLVQASARLEVSVSSQANARIKDASANRMRGDIARSLGEYDEAQRLYLRAKRSLTIALELVPVTANATDEAQNDQETVDNAAGTNIPQATSTTVFGTSSRVEIYTDRVHDGSRAVGGAVFGIRGCGAVEGMISSNDVASAGSLALVLHTVPAEECGTADIPQPIPFHVITHEYATDSIDLVLLDSVKQSVVWADDSYSTSTVHNATSATDKKPDNFQTDFFESTDLVLKKVFDVTQNLLIPSSR